MMVKSPFVKTEGPMEAKLSRDMSAYTVACDTYIIMLLAIYPILQTQLLNQIMCMYKFIVSTIALLLNPL